MAEVTNSVTGLTGNLQTMLTGFGQKLQEWVDKVFPPEKREKFASFITELTSKRPMLMSFIASHIAISGPAIGLFLLLTLSVAVFAILAGLILGLLGAVLFIVTAVGFALIVLLPTLFFTIGVATFLWLWGWGVYKILQYFNEKPVPGIHKPLGQGLAEEVGLDGLLGFSSGNDQNGGAGGAEGGEGEQQGVRERKKVMNGSANANGKAEGGSSHAHKSSGGGSAKKEKEGSGSHKESGSHGGDATKKTGDATKKVGDAGKDVQGKVSGVTGGLT